MCGGDDSKLYLFTPSADDNGKVIMVTVVIIILICFCVSIVEC